MNKNSIRIHKNNIDSSRESCQAQVNEIHEMLETVESDYLGYKEYSDLEHKLNSIRCDLGERIKSLRMMRIDLQES